MSSGLTTGSLPPATGTGVTTAVESSLGSSGFTSVVSAGSVITGGLSLISSNLSSIAVLSGESDFLSSLPPNNAIPPPIRSAAAAPASAYLPFAPLNNLPKLPDFLAFSAIFAAAISSAFTTPEISPLCFARFLKR